MVKHKNNKTRVFDGENSKFLTNLLTSYKKKLKERNFVPKILLNN